MGNRFGNFEILGNAALITAGMLIPATLSITAEAAGAQNAHFKKVMTIVLENTDYEEGVKQPFLASLIAHGALLSNFSAEAHPSQPNYIAMVSGSTQGVTGDSNANFDAKHIGDLLEAKGLQWKTYAEDYPGNCFQGAKSGNYARKHVPFLSFLNVQRSPDRCGHIVEASQLDRDLQAGGLPDYSFYVPNLLNDGHDTNAAYADKWLAKKFGSLLQDAKFSQDLLLVVTFDESETYFGNHILTVLYGNGVKPGSVSSAAYNHYSVLRTIEDELGLGTLGQGDATARPIGDGIWK